MIKDYNCLQTEIFILEDIKLVVLKDMANIIGKMGPFIEVNFYLGWDTEEEFGTWLMVINTKDNIWMIKKMEKVYIFGKMDPNM